MNGRGLLLCISLLLAGCSLTGGERQGRMVDENRLDDDYCVSHGLRYPSPQYEECRWSLAENRSYREWRDARVMQQTGQPSLPAPPLPYYRPQSRAGFHCYPQSDFDELYVLCGFDPPPH